MTQDERISAYIDNELSLEQEQEFLISLAASDGLRKSFRSELLLKKVLHRDEAVTNPPRKLRTAVFATLGVAAASELTASNANAASSSSAASHSGAMASKGFMKALFATKMNALVTAAGISVSALAGYGVHAVVNPAPTHVAHVVAPAKQVSSAAKSSEVNLDERSSKTASSSSEQSLVADQSVNHNQQPDATGSHSTPARVKHAGGASASNTSARSASDSAPVSVGVAGGGTMEIQQPPHKRK